MNDRDWFDWTHERVGTLFGDLKRQSREGIYKVGETVKTPPGDGDGVSVEGYFGFFIACFATYQCYHAQFFPWEFWGWVLFFIGAMAAARIVLYFFPIVTYALIIATFAGIAYLIFR